MIGAKNINAWVAKTEREKKRVRVKAEVHVRNRALAVLREAVKVSPQWSGNFAANWRLETTASGSKGYTTKFKIANWRSLQNPFIAHKAGDDPAVTWAIENNRAALESIKYNSKITLKNHAPVAAKIESGEVNLRPVNLIPEGVGVMAHLKSKFKFIK